MSEGEAWPYHLFEVVGIELEYMIVDQQTLSVRPICDAALAAVAGGEPRDEVPRGDVAWSNELALHVLEMKTNGPAASLAPLPGRFQASIEDANEVLAAHGALLMPSAMHPWMDPHAELKLWPHDNDVIYNTLHRIFDCRGHGWANLQSMHINLPFADAAEFGRLHAAIRLVLPLLPGLAASSPFVDGAPAGMLDFRLETYRKNAAKVPSVSALVIPEPVFTPARYQTDVLERIYADMAPHDPEAITRHEWINARGAIARFDRGAIEIRLLDLQEHPGADIAVAQAVVEVVRGLVDERWSDAATQRGFDERRLYATLMRGIKKGERAVVDDEAYLAALGVERPQATMGELWAELVADVVADGEARAHLDLIARRGTLARRLLAAAGPEPSRDRLRAVYRELCAALAEGRAFEGL